MTLDRIRRHSRLLVGTLGALVLVTAAACTATVEPTTPVAVPTVSIEVSPAPTPTTTSPLPPAGAPDTMKEVKVMLVDGQVTLSMPTVNAGPIRFMVKNDGTRVHAFAIEGQGISETTADLQAGESAVMDVTLTPGEYEAYCPVPGHRERGMTTMLTVQ